MKSGNDNDFIVEHGDLVVCSRDIPESLSKISLALANLYHPLAESLEYGKRHDSAPYQNKISIHNYTCNGMRQMIVNHLQVVEVNRIDISGVATIEESARPDDGPYFLHSYHLSVGYGSKYIKNYVSEQLTGFIRCNHQVDYLTESQICQSWTDYCKRCPQMYGKCPIATILRNKSLSAIISLIRSKNILFGIDSDSAHEPENPECKELNKPVFSFRIQADGWNVPGILGLIMNQINLRDLPYKLRLLDENKEKYKDLLEHNGQMLPFIDITQITNNLCVNSHFNMKQFMVKYVAPNPEALHKDSEAKMKVAMLVNKRQLEMWKRGIIDSMELRAYNQQTAGLDEYVENLLKFLNMTASNVEYVRKKVDQTVIIEKRH